MIPQKSIGGYFELELQSGVVYHENALPLNTARNAFEYILKAKKYKKAYMPYFTCSAMLEPLLKNNIPYVFYSIDAHLEPLFDFASIEEDAVFLYTNYFGLKDKYTIALSQKCKNLIIDNAQSFFSTPIMGVDTIYSPRKFFGLPDGGYLYTDTLLDYSLEKDVSYTRFTHLLKRIDLSAEEGFKDFILSDEVLEQNPIREMSNLTSKLLSSIDYNSVSVQRRLNFKHLHERLQHVNSFQFPLEDDAVPMVYPFYGSESLRKKLIENKIYTATYWPNVKEWCAKDSLEYQLTSDVIYLPVDQRYTTDDMDVIVKHLL